MFLDDGNTLRFWGLYNLNTDKSDPQTFGHYPKVVLIVKNLKTCETLVILQELLLRKPGVDRCAVVC